MSFPFRRRRDNEFKHIAHGLIPAATVAPRSAVPRTPPPRSPNPSPERPRSALAAAILMTSLTGRTVAMPHPHPHPQLRHRSYSENDSSYAEEESQIQPYASASELGVAHNWAAYSTRQNLSSPVLSSAYDDEDDDAIEEQMSDIEKRNQPKMSKDLAEEPIYSRPHKNRGRPTSSPEQGEVDGNGGASSSEADNVLSEHSPGEESRLDVESPEPRSDRGISQKVDFLQSGAPGVSEATQRHSPATNPEQERQLLATNRMLTLQNEALSSQVEELKTQIKSMRLKIKSLRNEKKELEEEARKTEHPGAEAAELASLQQQAQELVDENDALKMTIHRLNVELSRYQTKYRPLTKEENIKISGLPPKGPPPPWLLDMKFLSPLLLAYDDRLKEKDDLIESFEEEMKGFKVRVKEVVEENEKLHQILEQDRPVTAKEWELLQSQNKLLMEENRLLVETLEVQEGKSRESHAQHLQEVSQLTKQLMSLEATKRSQDDELVACREQQELLRSKYSELKESTDGKVAAEEHVAIVSELKRQLQEQRDASDKETRGLMEKMGALQAQSKALLLQKNHLLADNKILEAEMTAVQKTNRKMKRRVSQLKQQLEDALEKEVTAHQYLANLIMVAENIAGERDQLVHMAKGLEAEKHGALSQMMEGSVRLGRLEEMVKVYKRQAGSAVRGVTHRLTQQEEDFAGKAAQYQREMKHLRLLLQDRQDALHDAVQQKRQVEGELEVMWESASNENKQLKALLQEAVRKPVPGALQPDSIIHYCDVNSSPHREGGAR